jgi:predicted Zn-dependent protease
VRRLRALALSVAEADPKAATIDWRIFVMRDATPNVFSIGGGEIYLSEGIVLACRREAELAGVLAHEIGHELAGHFCEPLPDASEGAETHKVETMVQVIDADLEREADRIAVDLLRAARYEPAALLSLTERMSQTHPDPAARRVLGGRLGALRAAVEERGPRIQARPGAEGRLQKIKGGILPR